IQENGNDNVIKIASKPCGALLYRGDGTDIQSIKDRTDGWQTSWRTDTSSYFRQEIPRTFGDGTLLQENYKIHIAKASPYLPDTPVSIEDYKFVFIIIKNYPI
ncbi:MAG: hypothetical protein LBV31_00240, partial [Prevotellaceae bacterium]|nr:hypothetical protein [Prevotellaceae bacterium]